MIEKNTREIKPIIFGLSTTVLTEEEIILFQKTNPAGFILFSRNIESKNQLLELTKSIRNLFQDREVSIFTDQEGGRVARIKPPIGKTLYPAAEYFSDKYDVDPELAKLELKTNYEELTAELKSLGIDSPCAPVCDIFYKGTSNIVGDRSFGNNPDKVVDLSRSAITGIENARGVAILKHIPGHGRGLVDSHFELPIVSTNIEELNETDFRVFKELYKKEKNAWGMTAHIIYNALDKSLPATISKTVIKYIRNNIGFSGTLLTDDICMYALHGRVGKKQSTLSKVIRLAEKKSEWKIKYSPILKSMFDIDSENLSDDLIIEICKNQLQLIKPEFLASLKKVTTMSLEAGCDLVLHCSGDIEEMRAVCAVI